MMIGKKIFEVLSTMCAVFFVECVQKMLPFLLVMVVVIVADLVFGVKAAKFRGEVVRFSGAIRRTINKFIEYLCWISLAVVIDVAFKDVGVPLRYIILSIVFIVELQSCFNNYLEPKGKRIKINFKEIFGGKLKGINIVEKEEDETT